jgi:hypothetical protein
MLSNDYEMPPTLTSKSPTVKALYSMKFIITTYTLSNIL